jgi:hypothetical protein
MVVPFRRQLQKSLSVVLVHRNNKIEFFEVVVTDAPGLDTRQRHTTTFGCRSGSSVRWFADMVGMRASRVDENPVAQAGFLRKMPEYTFGRRRSANVAHADK